MRVSVAVATAALVGSALGTNHNIVVGKDNLTFVPDQLRADVGDTVTFKFWPKNHSVAQATFAKPCEPSNNGFWSGYIPSSSGVAADTYMITITNASAPLWFYCSQGKHCESGMVGAINAPTSGNTFAKFKSAAANVTKTTEPKSVAGTGGMIMNNGSTSSSGTSTSSASGTATSSPARSTGAASSITAPNGIAVTGLLGMMAYLTL